MDKSPYGDKKKMVDALVIHLNKEKSSASDGGYDEATESDDEKKAEESDPMAEVAECARDAFRAMKEDDEDAFVAAFTKALSDYKG